MNIALILTAAGSSSRIGLNIKKEYLPMDSRFYPGQKGTVLSCAAEAFLTTIDISTLVVTIPPESEINEKNPFEARLAAQKALFSSVAVEERCKKIALLFVQGGKTRQESVFNALNALKSFDETRPIDLVAVHDGARPFVSSNVITSSIETALAYGAATPLIPVVDTQKQIDERGYITVHLKRETIGAVQTPQVFRYKQFLKAHTEASTDEHDYTDDTEIWAAYVSPVHISIGDVNNIKITYEKDIDLLTEKTS